MRIEDAELSTKQYNFLLRLFEEARESGEAVAKKAINDTKFHIFVAPILKNFIEEKSNETLRNLSISYEDISGFQKKLLNYLLDGFFDVTHKHDERFGLYDLDSLSNDITMRVADETTSGIASGMKDWVRRQLMDLASEKLASNKSNNTLKLKTVAFKEPDIDREVRTAYKGFSSLSSDQKKMVLDTVLKKL